MGGRIDEDEGGDAEEKIGDEEGQAEEGKATSKSLPSRASFIAKFAREPIGGKEREMLSVPVGSVRDGVNAPDIYSHDRLASSLFCTKKELDELDIMWEEETFPPADTIVK